MGVPALSDLPAHMGRSLGERRCCQHWSTNSRYGSRRRSDRRQRPSGSTLGRQMSLARCPAQILGSERAFFSPVPGEDRGSPEASPFGGPLTAARSLPSGSELGSFTAPPASALRARTCGQARSTCHVMGEHAKLRACSRPRRPGLTSALGARSGQQKLTRRVSWRPEGR